MQPYSNNAVEADHGRLKVRLRPMRGLKTIRSLRTVAAGHAFVQNLRRGHYEFAVDVPVHDRVRGRVRRACAMPLTAAIGASGPQRCPTPSAQLLLVIGIAGDRICEMTHFETAIVPYFGLPRTLN